MIRDTYAEIILEQLLREILEDGDNPTAAELDSRFETFEENNDLTQPLFIADDFIVESGETSSATKQNNTNSAILKDLKVIYKHLFKISDQSLNNFDRWRSSAKLLERRLTQLEERLTSLLLLSEDTAGYFNFVQDNFSDNAKIELSATTAYVNVDKGMVSIGTSNVGTTRIDLGDLQDKDIQFTVLNKSNLLSTVSSQGSRLAYVVSDITNYWQEKVVTNKPGPMSVELKIDLLEEKSISRIDIDLHMSNSNSNVQITPMYSTDNFNYSQLPTTNFTRSIVDKSVFQFTSVSARYIKFIMTKVGYDVPGKTDYVYEFGVDEISFYSEGFATGTDSESVIISKPLSVTSTSGVPEKFSKLVLETCEDIPDNTSIDYYVTVSNNSDVPYSDATFVGIDPINRASTVNPTVLDFGDLDEVSVSGVIVSYNPTESTTTHVNPAHHFTLIEATSGTAAVTTSGLASAQRYSFKNSGDRILSHAVASGVIVPDASLEVWRNVARKSMSTKIRDYVNGWGFEEPYYKTTIYTDNHDGIDIDFGGKPAIIDGVPLSGKNNIPIGAHTVEVHKDNWKEITVAGTNSLAVLKAADDLYPYNHRYLIEGYSYSVNWPDTDIQVYRGFDTVAEYRMQKVSPFDLVHNVAPNDYSKFAIDVDAKDTDRTKDGIAISDSTDQAGNNVFLVKVDEGNPNFVDEVFSLKFKAVNTQYQYVRFKAVLKTEDTAITPFLDSFRIKISS